MRKLMWVLIVILIGLISSAGYLYYKDLNTEIALVGDSKVIIEYGDGYQELGANAIYNDKVIEELEPDGKLDVDTLGTYELSYKYKGTYNEQTIERTVEIVDTKDPTITLNGDSSIDIKVNDDYEELGAVAVDNYDGDITDEIKIEGSVDTSVVGTYTLIYKIIDSSNNKAEVSREVNVYKPIEVKPPTVEGGVIYLTFDDGPDASRTAIILDILKSANIKATFFVTGVGPDNLIKRAYDEGHTIALHTYSHIYADVYASIDNYYADLNKISSRVENITGHKSRLIRFPGGSSNTISKRYTPGIMSYLVEDVMAKGYIYHDWNVDSMDASGNIGAANVYQNTINYLSKGRTNIVLLHDVHDHTVNALSDIIAYGKANGFTFKAMDENTTPIHHGVNN